MIQQLQGNSTVRKPEDLLAGETAIQSEGTEQEGETDEEPEWGWGDTDRGYIMFIHIKFVMFQKYGLACKAV